MKRPPAGGGLVRGALALWVAGCASAPVQRAYVAATSETITSETEQGRGDRPSHSIYVVNRSTVPITVFGVTLSACENVTQSCDPRSTNIHVSPGARSMVMRLETKDVTRNVNYRFGFSWRADSSGARAATQALAEAGDPEAQRRLATLARADSLRRLGIGYRELSREEHSALRDRVALMRVEPESLVLAPGDRTTLDRVRLLLVDNQGNIVGRTRWLRWQFPAQRTVQFVPSEPGVGLVALRPGRTQIRYALAEEAQALFASPINEVELPVIVAYATDAHSPVFAGTATDADTKTPLACARIALQDSVQGEVGRARTDARGVFTIRAPHAGSYHVRVELDGWSPFDAPNEAALADEKKETVYAVRLGQQMTYFQPGLLDTDNHGAHLTGATAAQTSRPGAAPGQLMRLAGSASMPIVEIVSRAPPASTWVQFAVDASGVLDTASLVVPPGLAPTARPPLMRALPQLRFSPAREGGKPVCDLMRLQVNLTPR